MMRRFIRLTSPWLARWQTRSIVLHAPAHGPGEPAAIESGVQALSKWAQANAGARLEVGLSARWLLCAATPHAETAQQAMQEAAAQWAHYLGLDEASLPDEWVCMPVMDPAVRMVCAVPRALVEGLQEGARQHGVRVQAVLPWWAFDLQARLGQLAMSPEPAHAVEAADALEWAWLEPGWCTRVTLRRPSGSHGAAWSLDRIWMAPVDEGAMAGVSVMARLPEDGRGPATQAFCQEATDVAALLKGVSA